jgi:two-component sensor histidine kinase
MVGLLLLGSVLSGQSQPKSGQTRKALYRADSLLQVRIIRAGDSVYAQKQGYARNEGVGQMQKALVNSELVIERNKLAYEAVIKKNQEQLLWVLVGLLTVITGLSGYLFLRIQAYRVQSGALRAVNQQLDNQIAQVHLLNKEIQHRVKNNLHMIFSLLQMQERKSGQPEVVAQLRQARLRVEAISALNSQLSQENTPLDLNRYIASMVETVVHCYEKPVVTQLDVDLIALDRVQYLPLALILTEWITNSMKHAVPANSVLHIRISLYRQGNGTCIEYTDTGCRTPNPPHPSLGMDIVRLLCRQLNGTLTYPPQNPYHYRLLLPAVS